MTEDLEKQERFETAGGWYLRLRQEPALELSPEFAQWMSARPNARAYRAVVAAMGALEDANATPSVLAVRRAALDKLYGAGPKRSRDLFVRFAAAAAVFVLVGSVAGYLYLFAATDYVTGVGEHRQIVLSDGSKISLDADTEVSVRYSKSARTLTLAHGRAHFDVAHDIKRPFSVAAGAETVVAVGTSFNVERLGKRVLVTLMEGHVVVKFANGQIMGPATPPVRPIALRAGEELVAARNVRPEIKPADFPMATAWETGQLVFRGTSLADAVERENRYTDRPIKVDADAAAIRISGVFNAGDVASFVGAVTSLFPIQATTDGDNTITLQRRS